MVDSREDPMAVTMKIRRETRVANERAAAERAATAGEVQLPPPIPGTEGALRVVDSAKATVSVPAKPEGPARQVDPDTAYRRARMGVVAVVVLVLLLLWIRQRRAWAR